MKQKTNILHLGLIGIMFFAFGFVTWINAILIPFFKLAFGLDHFRAYLVTFAFYISYLTISLPASLLLKRTGFRNGMTIGFWIMSLGALLFIPAAVFRTYGIFLSGLFVTGIGLAVVQTAVNPYVTLLGDRERAARRISMMGICNKFAGILAPIIFSSVVFLKNDAGRLAGLNSLSRIIAPYIIVAIILVSLGLLIRFSSLPEIGKMAGPQPDGERSRKKVIHHPHVVLGAFAIFFHVGSQVIAIDTIINYAKGSGLPMEVARFFPSAVLFMTICGYLLGIIFVPEKLSQRNMLRVCSALGFCLALLVTIPTMRLGLGGYIIPVSLLFLVMLGLANSMIWACIWPLSLDRLEGGQVNVASSLLVMGLCGNALLPLVYGWLADHVGLQKAYFVLLPCYAYLLFFSWRGYKLTTWKLSVL